MVRPMSAGVGIADFAPVAAAAPTSLAYSGSTAGPVPAVGWAAICHSADDGREDQQRQQRARKPSEFFSVAIGISCRLMAKLST